MERKSKDKEGTSMNVEVEEEGKNCKCWEEKQGKFEYRGKLGECRKRRGWEVLTVMREELGEARE